MRDSIYTSLLIMLLVATGGCATYSVRSGRVQPVVENGVYPATRTDIALLAKGSILMEGGPIMGYVVAPVGFLLDIPVSLLTDTVTLPIDVYCLASSNEICAASPLAQKHPRPKAGFCQVCSYNLTGNLSGTCPVCGTAIK